MLATIFLIVVGIVAVFVAEYFFEVGGHGGLGGRGGAVFMTENANKFAELVQSDTLYPVVHVDDGDTIVVHVSDPADAAGHDLTVRLIGADTPETVDPRKAVQCFGREASVKGKEMLSGESVYIEKDPLKGDYEKYGRLLAYVRLPDGTLYNEFMIQNGFAREYTYLHQSYKYQADFKAAEQIAKKSRAGLWGKCNEK